METKEIQEQRQVRLSEKTQKYMDLLARTRDAANKFVVMYEQEFITEDTPSDELIENFDKAQDALWDVMFEMIAEHEKNQYYETGAVEI
ncbi:MAG: hypothetical protein LUC88_03660 [Prevotella sp.]|nr:hypothetical protein [Prevotella sp.]